MTNLNELAREIHEVNCANGFYDSPPDIGKSLMLCVTELSEAMEADRKDLHVTHTERIDYDRRLMTAPDRIVSSVIQEQYPIVMKDKWESELAGALIRIMDLANYTGVDLDYFVRQELEYNKVRGHKHGGKKY